MEILDCANQDTVQRLYRRFGKIAFSKVHRVLGRRELAQEVLQDVFVKLWQKAPRFESENAAYVWIYKSCHNAAIDLLRSAAHRHQDWNSEVDDQPDLPGCNSAHRSAETRQILVKALAILSTQEASILTYAVVDGMGHEEIAELLGISRKTVGRTLTRCEEKFRDMAREPA